ncbi:patatin-like phospholipase family protein [Frateuria hangzhouensis]|uniref:patatin-like phospholipase family protein n=1 Tax=Frateuria hangzhouensis TaxID=2995589 RepID=UPI00226097ED|nr:patatin-like phospholipase family protein [Frateuria sp. STR12]MCX7513313.1 patatin-like phospholipase family protein [Frateuria sp. STR12]
MSHSDPVPATDAPRQTIALALGAGGAKGLAHIGVIEELERQGYVIGAIAGSSMGALIGGIYAMGKLPVYRDWVCKLARFDVLRLVDWTFRGGLIKGEKIIETLRQLIGDARIEDLPLAYTAVATDIDREREVWLTRGELFDAIRASIAIPTIFRPYTIDGRRLVDGALLNPVPVTPLIRERADFLFAVSLDGPTERRAPEQDVVASGDAPPGWLGRLFAHGEDKPPQAHEPGALALLTQSMDLMQSNLSRLRLAAYDPDLLIQIPRDAAATYEFYRASELIELGRKRTREALERFDATRD